MKRSLYILSNGELRRQDNTLAFYCDEERTFFPAEQVSDINVLGEVTLNKRLLEFVAQHSISMHFFNYFGHHTGSFMPRDRAATSKMLLKQAEVNLNPQERMKVARGIIRGAIANMRQVLRYYANRGKDVSGGVERLTELMTRIPECAETTELMGVEGSARQLYYGQFDRILSSPGFEFERRTRRPPRNPLNCLLGFGNSLLYAVVLSEIRKTQLDPRIGFLHSAGPRSFSLNLDLAEPFKPVIVDRLIFRLIKTRMITPDCFDYSAEGVFLGESGKRVFVREFEEKLRTTVSLGSGSGVTSYRHLIRLEAYKLQKHILGLEAFAPFKARW